MAIDSVFMDCKGPAGKKFTRFGSRWVYGHVKLVVLRCPKCGREIDLGK